MAPHGPSRAPRRAARHVPIVSRFGAPAPVAIAASRAMPLRLDAVVRLWRMLCPFRNRLKPGSGPLLTGPNPGLSQFGPPCETA